MTKKPLTLLHIYGGAMKIGGHYHSGLAMAKGLIERGHRVIVVASDAVTEMVTAFQQAGAEFKLLPVVGNESRLPCLSGWKSISEIAERHNVDVIHSMDFRSIGRGYRAAIKTGKAFMCTESGGNSVSHFPPRKARVVIFSDEQMTIYRDLYHLPERNLKIIRARIDTDFYHPAPVSPDFINRYGLTSDGLAIGIVCRLETSKAHKIKVLIDFVKEYREAGQKINIYIVGDGDCRQALQAQAKKANNPLAKVHFIGPIYEIQQVNRFYNFCDIILGSGRGVMEAMACKKPVIIPGTDGQAELVGPDNIEQITRYNFSGRHFRTQKNAANLASILNDVGKNPALLQRHSEFCFDYVQKHLSARVGADQLIDWYKVDRAKSTLTDFGLWYLEASYWIVKGSLKYKLRKNIFQKLF